MAIDRRGVFRRVITELQVANGRGAGGHAFRLADLGALADGELAGIRPTLKSDCAVEQDGGMLLVCTPANGHRQRLCRADALTTAAIRAFDGTASLGTIVEQLSAQTGHEADFTFAYVRGFFLHLVAEGVCLPG
jgi:hypothetical protein